MARRSRKKVDFRRISSSVSTGTGIASLVALALKNPKAASLLMKASGVSGLASLTPTRKGVRRFFKGRPLSKLEKIDALTHVSRAGENLSLLLSSGILPFLAFYGSSLALSRAAKSIRDKRRKSRRSFRKSSRR